jgi:hypothetical protein
VRKETVYEESIFVDAASEVQLTLFKAAIVE